MWVELVHNPSNVGKMYQIQWGVILLLRKNTAVVELAGVIGTLG
jgi:hypothetical protein